MCGTQPHSGKQCNVQRSLAVQSSGAATAQWRACRVAVRPLLSSLFTNSSKTRSQCWQSVLAAGGLRLMACSRWLAACGLQLVACSRRLAARVGSRCVWPVLAPLSSSSSPTPSMPADNSTAGASAGVRGRCSSRRLYAVPELVREAGARFQCTQLVLAAGAGSGCTPPHYQLL